MIFPRMSALILSAFIFLRLATFTKTQSNSERFQQKLLIPQDALPNSAIRQNQPTGAAGYLLAAATDKNLNLSNPVDAKLSNILDRRGPDMRPLREFRDFDDISLEVSQRAWQLMHEHAHSATRDRVALLWPIIEQSLKAANVSNSCLTSSYLTAKAAKEFKSWAIQLLTSWGSFPPSGIYEGTYGDIGSFHGCLDVPESESIGHAHYCSLSYRPVMPTRRDYELVIRPESEALLNLFSVGQDANAKTTDKDDAFTDLLQHAQYSHYIYYKFAGCFPIGCSPHDVQKLAHHLGRQSILMSGPVKCFSKFSTDYQPSSDSKELQISTRDLNDGIYIWKPHMTMTQLVSLVVVVTVIAIILVSTLLDLILRRFCSSHSKIRAKTVGCSHLEAHCGPVETPDSPTVIKNIELEEDPNNNNCAGQYDSSFDSYEMNLKDNQVRDKSVYGFQGSPDGDLGFRSIPLNEKPEGVSGTRSSRGVDQKQRSLMRNIISDCSLATNAKQFFKVSQSQLKNDILCINGIRCITMSWIIVTHTMQYNDWSAFARTREIETHLRSLISQPLFNASYLVDTFFLMSGLLTSFTTFKGKDLQETMSKFSARSYLIGRYLRLTPQILFVSLLFILLPLSSRSASPHWYTITGEYSENCAQNWWVNLLHIQAFFRTGEMCNFVCWWVSVDMLFHLLALGVILVVLRRGHRAALKSCALLVAAHAIVQATRHFQLALPPNMLATIPQTGAMWSQMTLEFFWRPYAHALPFFLGLYVGYLMAQRQDQLSAWFNPRRAAIGWILSASFFSMLLYSTYFWVTGVWQYTRLSSTLFHLSCPLVWSACLTWVIVACHFGYGASLNSFLSCRLFVILGKASYVVYLSHFLVLFTFYGSQNLLLEPSQLVMLYVMLGNICLSMVLGCVLCVLFEIPWLKLQKRIMRRLD